MKYSMKNPVIPYLIDVYRTEKFGERAFDDVLRCHMCRSIIPSGVARYDVDGLIYCLDCSEIAEEQILYKVRDDYIKYY